MNYISDIKTRNLVIMKKYISLSEKWYSNTHVEKRTTSSAQIEQVISNDFTDHAKLGWSFKMYAGVLCSFHYCAIQTLEEICTSIINRYFVNIHQQLQYIKEIVAIYITDNACRNYVHHKVPFEFSSTVSIFSDSFQPSSQLLVSHSSRSTPCPSLSKELVVFICWFVC